MKLIFCNKCADVVALHFELRKCKCGESWGKYFDELYATIGGDAIAIGFANDSFAKAILNRPEKGMGYEFKAFVIPRKCPTIFRRK